MYTIAEFRKNMRKAFNQAKEGHQVVITKYDEKYQLVALVDKPLKGHSFEGKPHGIIPLAPIVQEMQVVPRPANYPIATKSNHPVNNFEPTDDWGA